MSNFESMGLKAGVWSGFLHQAAAPGQVYVVHMGETVAEGKVSEHEAGVWRIEVALPLNRLSSGVQSFMLLARSADEGDLNEDSEGINGELLADLSIVAGRPLELDLRAEIDLMRAELDLLKRELRRLATI